MKRQRSGQKCSFGAAYLLLDHFGPFEFVAHAIRWPSTAMFTLDKVIMV